MSKPKNLLLTLAIVLYVNAVVVEFDYSDDHKYRDDDDVTNVLTGGDNSNVATNSISGGRSYGLGLGDVDINDCLYSWSFIVQGVRLNKWCASERMDAMGLHDSAALMRCTIRSVNKLYKNKDQCIQSQTVTQVLHVERPEETTDTDEDDDERYEALYARITGLEAERVQDKATAEKVAKRANAMAQRTAQIAQQVPDEAAERRAMARAALKGEE